jgi:hypothetical protein
LFEMMLDATRRYDRPLTAERLFSWPASLFPTGRGGMTKIRAGDWRDDSTGPMEVVSGPVGKEHVHFQAPPAKRLEGTRQVGFATAVACFAPLLAHPRSASGERTAARSSSRPKSKRTCPREGLGWSPAKSGSAQEFAECSIGGQLSVSAKTKPTSGGEIALWAVTRRQHP